MNKYLLYIYNKYIYKIYIFDKLSKVNKSY